MFMQHKDDTFKIELSTGLFLEMMRHLLQVRTYLSGKKRQIT